MIHAGLNRKIRSLNKISVLLGISLLTAPSAAIAQEYGSGSGSRGSTTISNPRSPLSLIRRSGSSATRDQWASSNQIAALPVAQNVAKEPANAGSWAVSSIPAQSYPTKPPMVRRGAHSTSPTTNTGGRHTKFDRRYLNFPHRGINQVSQYPDSVPITGAGHPHMVAWDNELRAFMRHWQIPGASVSIVKNGKVLYSRGYGYADIEMMRPVQPNSVFRIGSVSKALTSVAVLKLVEDGRIKLSDAAIPILRYQNGNRSSDERINTITIQNLLQGTAGWDRSHNGDPMFMPIAQQAAQKYSNSLRPSPESIIRYQLEKPLDFEPGTKFSYSNLGYSILGEIITKTTALSYPDYVKKHVLGPLGLTSFQAGKTRALAPNEVCYYGYPGENKGPSVLPNIKADLPLEYGGDFYLEAMTADCGWVGNTSDVAKFVSAVFGGTRQHPLQAATVRQMIAPSPAKADGTYFAMGWEIDPPIFNTGLRIKKEGCLPGSTTLVLHRTDGFTCAIAFNSRPQMANVFQDETQKIVEKALNSCKTF